MLGEVGRLDAVAEADRARVGRALAHERLEQRRLAGAVRADEGDVLPALDHERAAVDQLLAARREPQPLDLDDGPARPGRLEELEAERAAAPRQVLELAGGLLALLLEPADLRQLGLRLLRLRLLVAEPLHESLQPLDVVCRRAAPTSRPPARGPRARAATGATGPEK